MSDETIEEVLEQEARELFRSAAMRWFRMTPGEFEVMEPCDSAKWHFVDGLRKLANQ